MVSFILWPLYLQGKGIEYPLLIRLGELQSHLDLVAKVTVPAPTKN
jgi:hypothetical protein